MTLNDLIANSPLKDEKIIVCKENSKEVRLITNNQKFYKIHLDDDKLLSNEQIRCDFILVSEDLKDIGIWIELKGGDITHACKQVKISVKKYGANIINKYIVIVFSSRTKPKVNTNLQKLEKEFRKNLFYGSNIVEIEYNCKLKEIIKVN